MSDMDITNISSEQGGFSVVEFAEAHPLILLSVVIVLVVLIIAYGVYKIWPKNEKLKSGENNGKKYLNDDEEIDSLISSVREKQKKNVGK